MKYLVGIAMAASAAAVLVAEGASSARLSPARSHTATCGATDHPSPSAFGGEWQIVSQSSRFEPPR